MQRLAVVVAAGLALALLTRATRADEEKVAIDKLPKAVVKAIKARWADAELVGAEKEKEEGKVVYDVSVKVNGQKMDVDVSPEGEVLGYEKPIELTALPKAVADTVKGKYPEGTPKKAEEVYKINDGKETFDGYEVAVQTKDGKLHEVAVHPNGKLKKKDS